MSASQPLLSNNDEDTISVEPAVPVSHHYHSINADPKQLSLVSTQSDVTVIRDGEATGKETRVYRRRWYVLILFSLMAGTQGGVWNTFGPISSSVEEAFGWDSGNIGLLTNWGPISFIVGTAPSLWALERKGLRVACLCAAFFIATGTVVRVFTMDPPLVTVLMNVGQALNGLAGPLAMAGPPALSVTWFPVHQRTTATAVGTLLGTLGTASSFLIGPMLVPDVPANSSHLAGSHFSGGVSMHSGSRQAQVTEEREAIHRLMYIECVWACALFLAMLIYFPKKPPRPPSRSAAQQRDDFISGLQRILRCRQFWVVGVVYGVSQGVLNCWSSIMDVVLKPHGIGEKEAGWIGFAAACGGCVVSIVFAVLADYMKHVMKWFVLVFYVVGTVSFTVFALAASNYITPYTELFKVSIIGGTTVVYASAPLLFELGCQAAYPAGEGSANGVLTLLNNVAGGVFLLVMTDASIGTAWMNWVLVGACMQCVPLLIFLEEGNKHRVGPDSTYPILPFLSSSRQTKKVT